MISEAAGAGVIRQDIQQAIERELNYRLGEGDAPGVLSRWQKELLLLVIHAVKPNACLSQLHARAHRPGQLLWGASGVGTIQHLAAEFFKIKTGIDVKIAQFKAPV